ncbi:interleukin 17a/f1 precursor [Silurus asotus]|uniref:Interleukin 17a/f1 n=1 Tax=Silurus asotus TaxID=30991 RepID=A0AAD5A7M2_SILAS|nr:interleukin 17a/f1 precursor [Silurus asotus]
MFVNLQPHQMNLDIDQKNLPHAHYIKLRAVHAAEDPDRTTKSEEKTNNAINPEINTIPHNHDNRENKMALNLLTLPCVMMMMLLMMMMVVTQAASLKPQGKLSEARCLLTGCLNWKGVETLELESRRIFRQVPVLQRVRGDDKNYFFRLEYKIISVGCTCVRPYVEQI